ncbi:hypothetical protein [Kribbella antibiotica]|uniref:hypothetical protein n=1 Tax=Kribbella antibiotica TaxID=190195 RepID=UPI00192E25FC|nr:hypothetical protein [Kribbella antibiotica]
MRNRFVEFINTGTADLTREVISPDAVFHAPSHHPRPEEDPGKDEAGLTTPTSSSWNRSRVPTPIQADGNPERSSRLATAKYGTTIDLP